MPPCTPAVPESLNLEYNPLFDLNSLSMLGLLAQFPSKDTGMAPCKQRMGAYLIAMYFIQCSSARAITVGLLHSSCKKDGIAKCIGRTFFAWGFVISGFTSCLLDLCHCFIFSVMWQHDTPWFMV